MTLKAVQSKPQGGSALRALSSLTSLKLRKRLMRGKGGKARRMIADWDTMDRSPAWPNRIGEIFSQTGGETRNSAYGF